MTTAALNLLIDELSALRDSRMTEVSHLQSQRDEYVAGLSQKVPGISTLAQLVLISPTTLGAAGRIDYLTALERQSGWLQATMQQAIVAVAGEKPSHHDGIFDGVDEAEREDVATALRMSANSAQIKIDVARTLVNHLPNTCSALATGEISPQHATIIARETTSAIRDGLGEAAIFAIEESALAYAEFHTPAQLQNKVRTTIAQLAPREFEEVVEVARSSRRVACMNDPDGMATVLAILPAEDAQIVMRALDAFVQAESAERVKRAGGDLSGDTLTGNARDDRSADMKRADALTSLASHYLSGVSDEVRTHRRPVTVNVTVDLPTLLGLAENPGQLAGYGAIPASVARALAGDGKWRRFITDPQTGVLLDYGRESYTPPQALVDYLIARDRTCRFPGCRNSAQRVDIDHAHSWEEGGSTSAQNLGLLCRRHHRLKTHGNWKLESFADGSCEWISPVGKKFFVPARPIDQAV